MLGKRVLQQQIIIPHYIYNDVRCGGKVLRVKIKIVFIHKRAGI